MKKILYICNYKGNVGGISGQVKILHDHMQQAGYECHIFSTIGNPISRIWLALKLIWQAGQYDVLHIHGCSNRGFLPIIMGLIAGKLRHTRVIVTYHGGGAEAFFAKRSRFARRWLTRANQVIVLNGFLEQVFKQYGIPCVVIPNILPDSKYLPTDKSMITPSFISVRHLRELYNIPCILRAFKRVQEQVSDASLIILGDGDQRPMLEQYVAENHLKNVQFVGQVPQEQVANYLAKADILLSAPRVDNMPVSVMEAMQAGLLVISSRVGGVPYVIEDGKTGLLFEYDNDAEMAERMLWPFTHQEEALNMIVAARNDAEKYTWNKISITLKSLYNI